MSFLASLVPRDQTVAIRLRDKYLYTLHHPRTTPTPKILSSSILWFHELLTCCPLQLPSSPVLTLLASPAYIQAEAHSAVPLNQASQPVMWSSCAARGEREVAESADAPCLAWTAVLTCSHAVNQDEPWGRLHSCDLRVPSRILAVTIL